MKITSLLTVSDSKSASNGYEMAGIPDGLGALRTTAASSRVLMNHEILSNLGACEAGSRARSSRS